MKSFMSVAAAVLGSVLVAGSGCLEITQNGAGSSANGTNPATDAGSDAAAITGTACVIAGTSQLCRQTSYCPMIVVDDAQYPNCAFRIRGSIVDIQCVCGGDMLCPMGTPSTCSEAAAMLAQQSEAQVCLQLSEGRCTPIAQTGTSTSSGGGRECDTFCVASCEPGDTGCRRVCGC